MLHETAKSAYQGGFIPSSALRKHLTPVLLLLTAAALRILGIGVQHLSGDEAFSVVNWARSDLNYLFNTIALIDPQPPLALLSFTLWVRGVGESEAAVRMLSALASLITVACAYAVGRRLGGQPMAAAAALWCGVSAHQTWNAQDARSYALWMALSALGLLLTQRLSTSPNKPVLWLGLAAINTAALYTYYLEGFFLIAQNVFLAAALINRRRAWSYWIGSQVLVVLLIAPWFLQPALRSSGYSPTGSTAAPFAALNALAVGETVPQSITLYLSGLVLAALITSTWLMLRRRDYNALSLTALHTLIPLMCLSLLAYFTGEGYFRPRYLSAASLPLILWLTYPLSFIAEQQPTSFKALKLIASAAVAALFAANLFAFFNYRINPQYAKAPNWSVLMHTFTVQAGPRDVIVRNYPDPAFDYYYQGPAEHITLPASEAAAITATDPLLRASLAEHDYVWLLPQTSVWDPTGSVHRWYAANSQPISEQWVERTHLFQYAAWEGALPAGIIPSDASFGGVVELVGYRFTPDLSLVEAPAALYVELFWRPISQTEEPLTVFIHLLNANSAQPAAQDDQPPQQGRLSTTSWPPGTAFRDVYQLELAAGFDASSWWLEVGWYDPATGARLEINEATTSSHRIDFNQQ